MTALPCPAHLAGGPLACTRTDPHDPGPHGGHTYESTSAGDDRHTDGGHG